MAEVTRPAERPGRSANRRKRYEAQMAAAVTPRQMLAAASAYFRATFARHGPTEVRRACDLLAKLADKQREGGDRGSE